MDRDDFDAFLAAFASQVGDPRYNPAADLDGDGIVSLIDYQLWFGCYKDANDGDGGPPTTPPLEVLGDFNHDFDVDQGDFGHLQACLTGANTASLDPGCDDADLDRDGDVDQDDFGLFQRCVSGAEQPLRLDCKY